MYIGCQLNRSEPSFLVNEIHVSMCGGVQILTVHVERDPERGAGEENTRVENEAALGYTLKHHT